MSDSDNTVGSNVGLPNAPDSTAPVLSDNKRVTDDLAPPARPTTSPSGFLDRTYLKTNGMYFQKTSNAILAMDHAQWYSPTDDASIPQTDEDHQKVVKKITDAFKDMSIAKDNEGNAYRKRLTPGANEFYPDWAIEDCAWIIVDFAKHIHTSGFRAPIYDRVLVEQIGQTQSWTFAERMDWLCLVLKSSKNIAVTLLKHEKVWTILGAPHKLFNSTMINNESNANRNRWVKDGRAMDTVHLQTARKRKYTSNDTSEDPMSTPSNSDGMSALVQRAKIPRKTRKSKLSTVATAPALGTDRVSEEPNRMLTGSSVPAFTNPFSRYSYPSVAGIASDDRHTGINIEKTDASSNQPAKRDATYGQGATSAEGNTLVKDEQNSNVEQKLNDSNSSPVVASTGPASPNVPTGSDINCVNSQHSPEIEVALILVSMSRRAHSGTD